MASTSASTPLATLRLRVPLLIVRMPDNPFLNAPLLKLLTVLSDVAFFATVVALECLTGGAILLRTIIGFLTLLIFLGAREPAVVVVVSATTLSNVVNKIRVLSAKPFFLLGTLSHESGYVPLLITTIVVYLEGLKGWWE